MDKINCPFCGAPVSADFEFGKKYVCSSCGQTSKCRVDDETAVKILVKVLTQVNQGQSGGVNIQAGRDVKIGGRTVAEDLITVAAADSALPASVESPAASAPGGFVCPSCKSPVVVKKNKPGKKHSCMSCKIFSQVSADGTCLEAAVMPSGDIGGDGGGVNIETDGDFSTGGDVIGRFKI
ncbi:hypothetical protein A3A84_04065 [Candidatus Collierbacteria bacterium RIFCSPLOWO2_01_FULL_50_23]|uniref:Uncharacterized protein n=1 Tax=Candidatus Collierbacteria bacterium RIFCSPHIGHO2_02_FULL_49_10 TaxID=1817723 RepID=A0A1F5EV41_9BACT|nr:MAG: hypothetical protein A3D09_03585 [Candidatus Collierbacteria bacterium RIFCSPHIGHO2_02_FULL_49_10]OGD73856.1 MAG: hypothetical protein A3A84_04065 [Candidatus Collierbacteria bacterium RIFCSPLOWO2_01_FULL_50_23]